METFSYLFQIITPFNSVGQLIYSIGDKNNHLKAWQAILHNEMNWKHTLKEQFLYKDLLLLYWIKNN